MDLGKIAVGKRLVVEKSMPHQSQFMAVGERGTIKKILIDEISTILIIDFDSGDKYSMNTEEFEFQVY